MAMPLDAEVGDNKDLGQQTGSSRGRAAVWRRQVAPDERL